MRTNTLPIALECGKEEERDLDFFFFTRAGYSQDRDEEVAGKEAADEEVEVADKVVKLRRSSR